MRVNTFYTAAILAKLCASTPIEGIEAALQQAEVAHVATTARQVDLALMALNDCKAQSCDLAHAAGSSGKMPTLMPEGASPEDIKCILKYNPAVGPLLQQGLPNVPKQETGTSTNIFKWLDSLQRPAERKKGETDKGTFSAKCAPNILIFSKGTLEPSPFGVTVGPAIIKGWDSTWVTAPVIYDPTVAGDFCLALPGGMVAKDMINQAAVKCPNSKIFLSGYSQGAMVVRNGLAYANDAAKSHIKVLSSSPFCLFRSLSTHSDQSPHLRELLPLEIHSKAPLLRGTTDLSKRFANLRMASAEEILSSPVLISHIPSILVSKTRKPF